ncbi:protein kinase domain-containing protein [Nocardioides cynanchi]|uniref:protein kinase domain-containing protein n=1 Tax=Nocardioides cynanchi TaxID=2558918 RepID=UPI0012460F4A|nr:protein kinase [Nocardioides cynanchi]
MAELVVYSYVGPGERDTAETLASELPADWVIVAGRALPTPQKDDIDLLVVGANRVFVLEQKHWGPAIQVENGGWLVKGELRQSPIGRNSQVAKILAGVLKSAIPGYSAAAKGSHLVEARVVLSHPKLDLDTSNYPYDDDQILPLSEAAEVLQHADSGVTGFQQIRHKVIDFVSGLSVRETKPLKLGPFDVESEVEGVGRSRVFYAKDSDGDPALLRAYPMDGWGLGIDVQQLVTHERQATKKIADIQRSWPVEATFVDEVRRWIVLPTRPIPSVSLARHAAAGKLDVKRGHGLTERAAGIVLDAFDALAEVHQTGVAHRGLMPERVLVGKNDRVLFRDFYLAHADSQVTVGPIVADTVDGSVPFRAPEVAQFIGGASPKADVYSLALTLLWWINGDVAVKDSAVIKAAASAVAQLDAVTQLLAECLADELADRPEAAEVAAKLRELLQPPPPPSPPGTPPAAPGASGEEGPLDLFAVGNAVGPNGRWRIERMLGQGGFASSWLATDTQVNAQRVIKQYHAAEAVANAQLEFEAAAKLHHPRCARVWDFSPVPPVYLVSDYIAGRTLKELGQERTATEEDYRKIALDILEALAYLHDEGQLHRDISPNNIVVRDDGHGVLIDFGLSVARADAHSVVGTPWYMAPEVATGNWSVSADLYALGASLLHAMLGRPPFRDWDKNELDPLTAEEEETWGPTGAAVANALFKLVALSPQDRLLDGDPVTAASFAAYLKTVAAAKVEEGREAINPTVLSLRRLYRGSAVGNAGNRGLDDEFARHTYVETRLDTRLTPSVLAGELDVVLLTGNPGDGKTSYLYTLREYLFETGAHDVVEPTAAGWRMKRGSRTYAAVYDASEARDGKTSDEILSEALMGDAEHTALVAINDGRLLNFFVAHQDVFPDCYVAVSRYSQGQPTDTPRIAIVDLKRRSVAPTAPDDHGLAGAVLDSFVAPALWTDCRTCTARGVCPILANRNLLREAGKSPLLELVSISHLRRKRRATFRDVRSAIAWTITGDRGCEDIHAALADGRDLRMTDDSRVFDVAFDAGNQDYLVAEWATVDPDLLSAPGVERALRDGRFVLDGGRRPGSEKRQLFFDGAGQSGVGRGEVRAYRFFDEFVGVLDGREDIEFVLAKVLLGLSRVLGAHGYRGSALALLDGESAGWSVLREIPAEEFTLEPLPTDATYVEQQPDGLKLSHALGTIVLTLDSYELVRRAAEGEILGDAGSDAVKLELSAFGNVLRTTPAHRVQVVDPAGRPDAIKIVDGVITREGANA